jgi:hypothetical protein
MDNIMTRKEAKRFKEIAELVNKVWKVEEANLDEDIKSKVYGVKPDWDKTGEGHVHVSSDIINICFKQGGIVFYSDNWKNSRGEQIVGVIGYIPGKPLKVWLSWTKRQKKFCWQTFVGYSGCHSYHDAVVDAYLYKVQDTVLHYIIENFDYEKVALSLSGVMSEIRRKEFGLNVAGDSYFNKKKD